MPWVPLLLSRVGGLPFLLERPHAFARVSGAEDRTPDLKLPCECVARAPPLVDVAEQLDERADRQGTVLADGLRELARLRQRLPLRREPSDEPETERLGGAHVAAGE